MLETTFVHFAPFYYLTKQYYVDTRIQEMRYYEVFRTKSHPKVFYFFRKDEQQKYALVFSRRKLKTRHSSLILTNIKISVLQHVVKETKHIVLLEALDDY